MVKTFRELTVWQKAMDLVDMIYDFTDDFPAEEKFGLISQIRRAAVSIPSNIAEGSRRFGKDGRHLLTVAFGSGAELETQLEISKRRDYLSAENLQEVRALLEEVMKMLNVMISKR